MLAVCSAPGIALDPLIIFKGKHMQTTWHGYEALPNTFYGKSENGEAWKNTFMYVLLKILYCYIHYNLGIWTIVPRGKLPPVRVEVWVKVRVSFRVGGQPDNYYPR